MPPPDFPPREATAKGWRKHWFISLTSVQARIYDISRRRAASLNDLVSSSNARSSILPGPSAMPSPHTTRNRGLSAGLPAGTFRTMPDPKKFLRDGQSNRELSIFKARLILRVAHWSSSCFALHYFYAWRCVGQSRSRNNMTRLFRPVAEDSRQLFGSCRDVFVRSREFAALLLKLLVNRRGRAVSRITCSLVSPVQPATNARVARICRKLDSFIIGAVVYRELERWRF